MNQPKFEAVIEQPIHVHLKGDSSYYTAETMEEAESIKADLVKRAGEKWLNENSAKTKQENLYDFIRRNVENYTEHLKKQLWHDQRDGTAKEVIEVKKRIMGDLNGIIGGKVRVEWHQSFSRSNDATHYSLRLTTKEERDELGV